MTTTSTKPTKTTKTTAKTPAKRKAAGKPAGNPAKRSTAQDEARKFLRDLEAAQDKLGDLVETVNQGEWMAITRALDLTRAEIAREESLQLLAMAYIVRSRAGEAVDWTELLSMTDNDLYAFHKFPAIPGRKPAAEDARDAAGGEHADDDHVVNLMNPAQD